MKVQAIGWACLLGVGVVLTGCGNQESKTIEDSAVGRTAHRRVTPPAEDPLPELTPVPGIVARVGDREITEERFQREQAARMRQLEMRSGKRLKSNDQFNALLVKSLIDSEVLTILANEAGIEVSEAQVEARFEENKSRMASEEAFQAYLEREDLTKERLLELMRDSMAVEKFVDEATGAVEVTEEELAAKYEELKSTGRLERQQDTTDVSHILIKVAPGADEAAWEAAKQRAEEAHARVLAGEDFAEVAKEMSQDPVSAPRGGSYDEVPRGRMVPEFEEMMLKTQVGEVSELFKTDFGWHFLTVTGQHKAGTMTLDEVRDDLRKLLADAKKRELVAGLVAEAQKTVDIEVFYLKDVVMPFEAVPEQTMPAAPPAEPDTSTQPDVPAADQGAN